MSEERTYTFEEARALIPQIRAVLLQLAIEKRRFDDALGALHGEHASHAQSGGSHAAVDDREAALAHVGEGIRGLLALLESLGVKVRDLEVGLVDIPTLREGVAAWLCWQLSDADVGFWHSTTEGFANRRPW